MSATKPRTHKRTGTARRPDGSEVALWRVETESPDLWCRISGRHLARGEEFTKAHVNGVGPVPVSRRVAPFVITERRR